MYYVHRVHPPLALTVAGFLRTLYHFLGRPVFVIAQDEENPQLRQQKSRPNEIPAHLTPYAGAQRGSKYRNSRKLFLVRRRFNDTDNVGALKQHLTH